MRLPVWLLWSFTLCCAMSAKPAAERYTDTYDSAFQRWSKVYTPYDPWQYLKAQGVAESGLNRDSRNPSTGENAFHGEYLINAQGEDVVAGIRTPQHLTIAGKLANQSSLPAMEETMPEVFRQLVRCATLWRPITVTCRTLSSRSSRGSFTCCRRGQVSALLLLP